VAYRLFTQEKRSREVDRNYLVPQITIQIPDRIKAIHKTSIIHQYVQPFEFLYDFIKRFAIEISFVISAATALMVPLAYNSIAASLRCASLMSQMTTLAPAPTNFEVIASLARLLRR
jgi:hypothetical protein